jgi:DNA-binding response OmpR family regulator
MVSWERLIDMLYATDEGGGPENPTNVVSVVVCALRRKMLHTGYQIVTVHHEGFVLKHRSHLDRHVRIDASATAPLT